MDWLAVGHLFQDGVNIFPAAKGGNRYLGWMERASVSGVEEDFYIWGGRRGLLLYLGWMERTFTYIWGGRRGLLDLSWRRGLLYRGWSKRTSISGVEEEDFYIGDGVRELLYLGCRKRISISGVDGEDFIWGLGGVLYLEWMDGRLSQGG